MAAVTIAEMQAFLRATDLDAADIALLQADLDAALGMVAAIVGNLDATERTERVYPTGSGYLRAPFPIDSAQTVTVTDPDGTSVTPDDVDYDAGLISLLTVWSPSRAWSVTCTPQAPPTGVLLAVKIIASHLFELHRGRGNTAAGTQQYIQSVDDLTPPPTGFAMPRRAQELLATYSRGPFA